jgi:MFS family permease
MPFFGLVVVIYQTVAQSIVQQHTPMDKQGRVMSLFMLGTMGTTPVGGLITGWITDAASPRASLAVGGVAPLLCAGWLLLRSSTGRRSDLPGPVLALEDRVERTTRGPVP